MTCDTLEVLKSVYRNDSSCILILDSGLSLIWHNGKSIPFDPEEDLKTVLCMPEKGSIESGDYSYSAHGIIYEYHLTNVSDEYYVIACSDLPAIYRNLESRYTREHLENALAASKLETMNICAAAVRLNDCFEGMENEEAVFDELNEQTNIIMKNCSAMLKEQYLMEELLRYYREGETECSVINFSEIARSFANCCSRVLGPRGSTKISCDISEDIFINASGGRVEYFLLCLFVLLRKKYKGVYHLKLSASVLYDEAVFNMKLIPLGDDEPCTPLLSEFIPLHRETPEYEMENMVVRKFLERYEGMLIDSTESSGRMYSVRMPVAEMGLSMKLSSERKSIAGESVITPYHAVLWDISDFRYY
ncbi:MAG: hypothetical protein ACI4JN_04185 [Ruminococcus sp.]